MIDDPGCLNCGRITTLDHLGGCSAECDDAIIREFVAQGHDHGPDDPPEDCPRCARDGRPKGLTEGFKTQQTARGI